MTLAYAHEKFSNAIHTLAVSPGKIKDRLISAFVYHLAHIQFDRDLPIDLHDDFNRLMERVTKKEPVYRDEGRIQATIRTMRSNTAVKIAREIMVLAYQVEQQLAEERKHV